LTRDQEYALKLADLEIAKANAEQSAAQQAWENQMAIAKFQYQLQQDAAGQYGSTGGGSGRNSRSGAQQGSSLVSPEEIERWFSLLTPKERGEVYKGAGEQNKEYRQEIVDSVGPDMAEQMMRSFNMFLYADPAVQRKKGVNYWSK
jgi:hypothetical protein